MRASIVFAALLLGVTAIVLANAKQTTNFGAILSNLEAFQSVSGGGFRPVPREAQSIASTAHGLFLSSLYGLSKSISPETAVNYVASLRNSDNGYGRAAGFSSDAESTFHALWSYKLAEIEIPNAKDVLAYLDTLWDQETRLYASARGESGNLFATAHVLSSLTLLDDVSADTIREATPMIRETLSGAVVDFGFPATSSADSAIKETLYGLISGSIVGLSLDGHEAEWTNKIASLQVTDMSLKEHFGGFYSDAAHTEADIETTSRAVFALSLIDKLSQKNSAVQSIDARSLLRYLKRVPMNLDSAFHAHFALAVSGQFASQFIVNTQLDSSSAVDGDIVQGTQLKPILYAGAFDIAHSALDATAVITYPDGTSETATLSFVDENDIYILDSLVNTENLLGDIKFEFILNLAIPFLNPIAITAEKTRRVGYGLAVEESAEFNGKEVSRAQPVRVNTEFEFAVKVSNATVADIVSGDFAVRFQVLDSSSVVLFSESHNADGVSFKFAYTLDSHAVPTGSLSFVISTLVNGVVVAEKVSTYSVSNNLVATHIHIEGGNSGASGPSFRLGNTVTVTMQPASLVNLRTVHPFEATVLGKDVSASRKFVLDIVDNEGQKIQSVEGTPAVQAENHVGYTFAIELAESIKFVGRFQVVFRYVSADGVSHVLSNYDSTHNEVFDDLQQVGFSVDSDLRLASVKEQPSSYTLRYGSNLRYRFRIQDRVSNKFVSAQDAVLSGLYLEVSHSDNTGRSVVTGVFAATQEDEYFVIDYTVNPNAVAGAGKVALVVLRDDGERFVLRNSDGGSVEYSVTVGGVIDVVGTHYSTKSADLSDRSVFSVHFHLTCESTVLKSAALRANILYVGGKEPVALVSGQPVSADADGEFSVAWVADHGKAKSGSYRVDVYRESDVTVAKQGQDASEEEAKPLASVEFSHKQASSSKLPIKLELVALVILIASVKYMKNFHPK